MLERSSTGGRTEVDLELSQRLKFSVTSVDACNLCKNTTISLLRSPISPSYSLIKVSSWGIQEYAKWQFCRKTHLPSLADIHTLRLAFSPCPCPKEMASKDCPWSSANCCNWPVGSTSAEKWWWWWWCFDDFLLFLWIYNLQICIL